MLKKENRSCDICEREIPKGARYTTVLIEREMIPAALNVASTGLAADALGNLRIDICVDCREHVGLRGEEVIC